MKFSRISLLIFFALVWSAAAYPQDPHVFTKYLKEDKETVVYTDRMFVIDTPSQFMQLKVSCSYPKQQPVKLPKRISLIISSHTRTVLYRNHADRKLLVTADGKSLRFTPTSYELLKGETKNGKDYFWFEWNSVFGPGKLVADEFWKGIGYENTLPKEAQIRAGKDVNGVFMEEIFLQLKPEQFLEIAKAQMIDLQLGSTKFGFTENQMSTMRDFAKRITP